MKILDFEDFGWISILLAFQEAIKKNSKMINEWPIEWYLNLDNLKKLDNLKLSLEKEMFWTSSRKRIFQPFKKFDSSFLKEHSNPFKQSTEALNNLKRLIENYTPLNPKRIFQPFKKFDSSFIEEDLNIWKRLIEEANEDYFKRSNPKISDLEYDEVYKRLVEREDRLKKLVGISKSSPSQKIGSDQNESFKKVKHSQRIQGLMNVYNGEELRDFEKRIKRELDLKSDQKVGYTFELKIDGVSLILRYESGELKQGMTRGNGEYGDDITRNIQKIKDIPKVLKQKLDIEVRGEVYIPESEFQKWNQKQEVQGKKKSANARNFASGSLKLLNSNDLEDRGLKMEIHAILGGNFDLGESHYEHFKILKELGFKTNDHNIRYEGIEGVIENLEDWEDKRKTLDYEVDGIVIKVDRLDWQRKLGGNNTHPKWAVAYKFSSHQKMTRVEEIELSVGMHGSITPTAVLEPIQLSGVMIRRASLHNFDELRRKDIRVGDYVMIERAGGTIPQVIKVVLGLRVSGIQRFKIPTNCPSCGHELRKSQRVESYLECSDFGCENRQKSWIEKACSRCWSEDLERQEVGDLKSQKSMIWLGCKNCGLGKKLMKFCNKCGEELIEKIVEEGQYGCVYWGCLEKKKRRIQYFVSKNGLDIAGLGEGVIEKLMRGGLIEDYGDIYHLRKEDLLELEGFKTKSVDNLIGSIEQKRNVGLQQLISALGIKNVGTNIAKDLASRFQTLERIKGLVEEDFKGVKGMGQMIAKNVVSFFEDVQNKKGLEKLEAGGLRIIESPIKSGGEDKRRGFFEGKKFVLTGKLKKLTRNEAEEMIQELGGRCTKSVNQKTDYIIAGEKAGQKLSEGKRLDIEIIDEEELLKRFDPKF